LSLQIGSRVADYEVIGLLGRGGMGAVYEVRHLISDRLEAMKVLLPDLEATPDLAERFVREIRLQASLSHPNVASLHNALRVDNQLLMVMEFVEGETLSDILRRGALPEFYAVDVGVQILAALDYAHSRGVVHRDVKPSNVIVNRQGVAKLMDFGIARGLGDLALTQTGAAIGSMYYMSPEQVRGQAADARSDVYAAAVTLYEAVTGTKAIAGGSAAEVLRAQLEVVPAAPHTVNAAISVHFSDALMRALEKDPARRFQSAGDFRLQLMKVRSGMPDHPDYSTVIAAAPTRPAGLSAGTSGARTPVASDSGGRNTPVSGSQSISFDPLGLERLRKDLAEHIGPMAKILVERAARRAKTWPELYAQLAPEIPAGKRRERFLASCPRG
jgi:eukaryotic-like serine/threonine-protein kinase